MRKSLQAHRISAVLLALSLSTACQRANAAGVQPGSRGADNGKAASGGRLLPLPSPALARVTANGKVASIADVVEKVVPSVVSISSTRVARTQQMPFEDPFFRFFFGPGQGGGSREQREQGLGSGVIVGDGLVVTNNHVVDHADEVKVATLDNRQFDATVVGADPKTDLALLRLKGDTKGLKPIALGDSSRLRLGDVVLAVGNPFGVGQTVTMGIVSAKNRSDLGIEDYEDFIQTDAAINPGNSGGALVDMEGNLVGINTAILSRSGGNVGIGFAIPSNMARPIVESLLNHGKVVRGWLGVAIQPLDSDMAKALNLPENSGVLVSDVTKDTPAAKAGVRRGDVIVSVDDIKVRTTGELRNAIATSGVNRTVRLRILREGKEIVLNVPLAEMPGKFADSSAANGAPSGKGSAELGMELQPLTPELRKKLDVPAEVTQGVVISDLDPRGDAARAGLRPGDVVLELNRQRVSSPSDLQRLWQGSKGSLLALVLRKGTTNYVIIKRSN
jgi:serine protease Do